MSRQEQPSNFDAIISAAEAENWDYVDDHLAEAVAGDPVAVERATELLDSPVENLRDLAASVFEESKEPLAPEVARKLVSLMSDEGRYVQFRAACALCAHGDRSPAVIGKIQEFTEDPDVASIAERYLSG
jgi:HEAT repeat protein